MFNVLAKASLSLSSFYLNTLRYYAEVHYGSEAVNDSFVSLSARHMDTSYTEADTGNSEHEIQELRFTSTVKPEIWVILIILHNQII